MPTATVSSTPQKYTNTTVTSLPLDNSITKSDFVSFDLKPTIWDKGSTIDFYIESSKDGVKWSKEMKALGGDPATITGPYWLATKGPTIETAILPAYLRCTIVIKGKITFGITGQLGGSVI